MRVVIRTDASLQIGTGHVMRCVTFADALVEHGATVQFICREHSGNLISYIQEKGFKVFTLGLANKKKGNLKKQEPELYHAMWLGVSQQQDAEQSREILEQIKPDWLIVDHYAIDQTWQVFLKSLYAKLMVIDDLADRSHQCDLLLDQNYGSTKEKYKAFVPEKCLILAGAKYALLRPEFSRWRKYSLQRREQVELKNLLISIGGVDADNMTGRILEALNHCHLPEGLKITVIMGGTAPHLKQVQNMADSIKHSTDVMQGVNNMAELMANTDLAIGAAGATTWERCCLGLPTIQIIVAENQKEIAEKLSLNGVVKILNEFNELPYLVRGFYDWGRATSKASAQICNGAGGQLVLNELKGLERQ